MRKVIASQLMTVDGYFEAPNHEFVPPPWNDELETYSNEVTTGAGALLFGRVGFQMMKAFWEPAGTDPTSPSYDLAQIMNRLPKVVFSRTLNGDPGWNGRVARDAVPEVTKLKLEPGGPLVVFGSAEMMGALVAEGLVDEIILMVNPLVMGGGSPLFKGGHSRIPLKLLSARGLDNGVVLLRYEVAK